jgi:hypothetical protein
LAFMHGCNLYHCKEQLQRATATLFEQPQQPLVQTPS